jgi:hypothetical protein
MGKASDRLRGRGGAATAGDGGRARRRQTVSGGVGRKENRFFTKGIGDMKDPSSFLARE